MGHATDHISPSSRDWLLAQKIFFVATAPLGENGHVNCSPKGHDSFRVLGDKEVCYLDFTGSGVETISHLQENGRIVLLFCALSGPPRIVRLHGQGSVLYPGTPGFQELLGLFERTEGARAVIKIAVTRVTDSCGFSIPLFDYQGERDTLRDWAAKKGPDGVAEYRRNKNATSIDGLEGYRG